MCLKSVIEDIKNTRLLKDAYEILVVDNASQDGSLKEIEKIKQSHQLGAKLQIINNQKNEGFARANNRALQLARGKYFLFLNSDTIVNSGALEALITSFKSQSTQDTASRLGLVAASLWNPDGSYQSQGGDQISLLAAKVQWLMLDDLPFLGKYLPSFQRKVKQPPMDQPLQFMGWVGATALCFPRKLYETIGGLDESIFMYAEDVEYCLRAKRAGWRSAIAHHAKITHIGSASGNSEQAKLGEVRGILSFWPTYFGTTSTFLLKLIITAGAFLRAMIFSLLGRGTQSNIYKNILQQLWV